jgi:hypothetical protein
MLHRKYLAPLPPGSAADTADEPAGDPGQLAPPPSRLAHLLPPRHGPA